jgi:hypothetical protein
MINGAKLPKNERYEANILNRANIEICQSIASNFHSPSSKNKEQQGTRKGQCQLTVAQEIFILKIHMAVHFYSIKFTYISSQTANCLLFLYLFI